MWPFTKKKPARQTSVGDLYKQAILTGDAALIRSCLDEGADVNDSGVGGIPPLALALAKGHREIAGILMFAGADVNRADPSTGMNALHGATVHGLDDVVARLIQAGANVNASFGQPPTTALAIAYRKGNRDLARLLLRSGADPNSTIDPPEAPEGQAGTRPIHHAAAVGDIEMIRLLAEHKANLDVTKDDGLTPLMVAAFTGQLDSVKALVEAGAKKNLIHAGDPRMMFSALDLAANRGHEPIVEYLKSQGAVAGPKPGE